jgi:hypothetical protein
MKRTLVGILAVAALLAVVTVGSGEARADDPKVTKAKQIRASEEKKKKPEVSRAKYSCSGKEELTISGETISVGEGVALRASGHCVATLKEVVISAPTALEVSGSAQVKFTDGSIAASQIAVRVFDHGKVTITDASVTAPSVLELSDSALVVVGDSSLNGESVVKASDSARVEAEDSVLTGRKVKLDKAEIIIRD